MPADPRCIAVCSGRRPPTCTTGTDEPVRHRSPPAEQDTTGAVHGTTSPVVVNGVGHRAQGLTWRHGVNGGVVADLPRPLLRAQMARRGPGNDAALLPAWLQHARPLTASDGVGADADLPGSVIC